MTDPTIPLEAIRRRALDKTVRPSPGAAAFLRYPGRVVANAATWGLGCEAGAVYRRRLPGTVEEWLWLVVATPLRSLDADKRPRVWWGEAWLGPVADFGMQEE